MKNINPKQNKSQGKLIIFSAPSGAGKTTIVKKLLEKIKDLEFSISACSRKKRKNETNGIDYYFLKLDEFKKKIKDNEFIEWQQVYKDHYYGTLKTEIERIWAKGSNVIFDIDVVGGLNIKKMYKDKALSIFIMPPSLKHLEKRLKNRLTETPKNIKQRLDKVNKELKYADKFDKIIINDDLKTAVDKAEKIVVEWLNK